MLDKQSLETALKELPVKNPQVDVQGEGKEIVITLTSDSFKGMNVAKRQAMVWDYLRSHYSPDDLVAIEFVFTNVPGEDTADQE